MLSGRPSERLGGCSKNWWEPLEQESPLDAAAVLHNVAGLLA
jgi:hypothetical protein